MTVEDFDPQTTTRRLIEDEGTEETHLAPGITLAGRYLVEKVIGAGGMGSVYRARDMHFPNIIKLVAIKEVSNQYRDTGMQEIFVKNFEREANIIATLSHPAIPRVYDFFFQGDEAFLVLEYILGKDLEAIVNDTEGFIPEDQIVAWAVQICEVLEYLHTHQPEPVTFRDVKPSNIMINQHNHVVLVDFGIAKSFQPGQKGTMMGTEGYSPPEQYRGEASPLVDIYALGATLHHLLTRSDPQRETPFTFSERPVRRYNPSISSELIAIVNKALQYQAEDRFQSATEMRLALLELKNLKKSRVAMPEEPAAEVEIEKGRDVWVFKCEDEVRGSPAYDEGTVYIGSLDNNMYAINAGNGTFLWKFPTMGAIVGKPAVRDRYLYFGSEDNNLYVISAGSGRLLWSYTTGNHVRSSPCLSDNYAFIGSDDGYLHCINVNSGVRAWRFHVGSPVRSTPCFQGNQIYFGSEGGDFYCLDLLGAQKWHYRSRRAITSSPTILDGMVIFNSLDGNLYAFDAKNGWEVWRFRMEKGSICSPCTWEQRIYTGSADGKIYCVDASTAREVWSFRTDHQVSGSPVLYNGFVFCGSVDGNMYCLDARSGRLIWKFATEKPITGTPFVVDDQLYFGSTNSKVYALSI